MLRHLDINNDKRMLYEIQIEEIIKFKKVRLWGKVLRSGCSEVERG